MLNVPRIYQTHTTWSLSKSFEWHEDSHNSLDLLMWCMFIFEWFFVQNGYWARNHDCICQPWKLLDENSCETILTRTRLQNAFGISLDILRAEIHEVVRSCLAVVCTHKILFLSSWIFGTIVQHTFSKVFISLFTLIQSQLAIQHGARLLFVNVDPPGSAKPKSPDKSGSKTSGQQPNMAPTQEELLQMYRQKYGPYPGMPYADALFCKSQYS